ncbi:hypothetical protein GCM10027072_34820 [Streptomyces bullii]
MPDRPGPPPVSAPAVADAPGAADWRPEPPSPLHAPSANTPTTATAAAHQAREGPKGPELNTEVTAAPKL